MLKRPIVLTTRGSRLAMTQTNIVCSILKAVHPGLELEVLNITTTGDRNRQWSLEKQGGVGLFTKELERALVDGSADVAIHSAKDLPTEMPEGLCLLGFLAREHAHDIFVVREDCNRPKLIATGSPRRRAQAKGLFPDAHWAAIRGNVETRLKKIADGGADATFLAAAGLRRLGINGWPGVIFKPLSLPQMVPAPGQAAIALQCRQDRFDKLRDIFDSILCRKTGISVGHERHFLRELGGGCHSAYAAHFFNDSLILFTEETGFRKINFRGRSESEVRSEITRLTSEIVG